MYYIFTSFSTTFRSAKGFFEHLTSITRSHVSYKYFKILIILLLFSIKITVKKLFDPFYLFLLQDSLTMLPTLAG